MLMLITYDISLEDAEGQTRLRRVAKLCLDYRRARAVFGVRMRHRARSVGCFKRQTFENIQPRNRQPALYHLGSKWQRKV